MSKITHMSQPITGVALAPVSNQLYTMGIAYDTFPAGTPGSPTPGILDHWTNNLGYPLFITGVEVWIGEDGGAITDTGYDVINTTRGDVYISSGWDHYGEPANINSNKDKTYWGPDYYVCMPGDVIEFKVSSVNYSTTPKNVSAGCLFRYKR